MRLVLFLAALAACGGAGGSDSGTPGDGGVALRECGDAFSACGGDPTGTWNVETVCDPGLTMITDLCPTATYEVTADRSSGVIDLAASGTYDRDYHLDLDYQATVPKSCLALLTCDALPGMSGGIVDSCEDTGESCHCSGTYVGDDVASGTWELDGQAVITDGSERTDLCIAGDVGDTLHEDGTRVLWVR